VTALYQLAALLQTIADASTAGGDVFDEELLLGQVDQLIVSAVAALDGPEEAGTLSGGNRQRLNIAIGLLGAPPVLLLDEPSAALDPRQRERLWAFVSELPATVIYSTHDVGEAERYADRVLVLADGELLFSGTPQELQAQHAGPDLEAAFVAFLHEKGH
jgi:ABC-type multidrug transport system ATPase subunit